MCVYVYVQLSGKAQRSAAVTTHEDFSLKSAAVFVQHPLQNTGKGTAVNDFTIPRSRNVMESQTLVSPSLITPSA